MFLSYQKNWRWISTIHSYLLRISMKWKENSIVTHYRKIYYLFMTTIHRCQISVRYTHQVVWTWEHERPDDRDSTVIDVDFFCSQKYNHFVSDIFCSKSIAFRDTKQLKLNCFVIMDFVNQLTRCQFSLCWIILILNKFNLAGLFLR